MGYRRGRTGLRRLAACVAAAAVTATTVGVVPQQALAEGRCTSPGGTISALPWAQQTLDPQQVWPFSTGRGRTVAVLDTGVDAAQPQLAGHVESGTNVAGGGSANTDCAGHGTQVAGVIAAQHSSGIGFRGLAPDVTVLPIALTAGDSAEVPSTNLAPKTLAKAIDAAVARHADIITVPYAVYQDSAKLKAAVDDAHRSGALVVAATGDLGSEQNPTPYPASYSDVLAVGSLAQDGSVSQDSGFGSYVDLVAPGAGVVTTQTGHGQIQVDGTAYAAGFASAVAALLWSRFPDMSVDDLVHRLKATAAPGGEAPPGRHYGWGIADPYQAIVGRTEEGAGHALPSAPAKHVSKEEKLRAAAWSDSTHIALIVMAGVLAAALVIVACAVFLPRGRRRRWRAGQAPGPYDDPEADTPSPPVHLFKDPETGRP